MPRYAILILFTFFSVSGFTQKNRFIYIQTETPQHFFVKMDDAVKNASAAGYVIIPELKSGKHDITIGFPDASVSDQRFEITLQESDKSFLLKKFDDKGWGLYDLQEMSITQAIQNQPGFKLKPVEEVSAFTDVLAKASGDSTLRYKATVEEKKPEPNKIDNTTSTQVVNTVNETKSPTSINTVSENINKPPVVSEKAIISDTGISQQVNTVTEVQASDPPIRKDVTSYSDVNFRPSKVSQLSQSATDTGTEIMYKDLLLNGEVDTIRIFIEQPVSTVPTNSTQPKPSSDLKFLDVSTEQSDNTPKNVKEVNTNKNMVVKNDICKSNASEKDINQVRSKMALAVTDESMIIEAQKLFIKKCFSSSQVKRLSELFVTNAGKYSFFNAVYNYVSDQQFFYTLQEELNDEHYKGRFLDILQK